MSLSELVESKIKKNEKYFSEELSYKLENESLPILMQDLPGLALLSKIALESVPSIPKIKSNEDVYLTILAIIFKYSLQDLREIDSGFLLEHEKFFKKLENTFIFFLDFHMEATKYQRGKLKHSIFTDFIKVIQKYINPNYTLKDFFNSISYAHNDICLTYQEYDKLKTYIKFLENDKRKK